MSPEELREYAESIASYGDTTSSLLRQYARTKAAAMELRTGGQVAEALVKEDRCDEIYALLPDRFRW